MDGRIIVLWTPTAIRQRDLIYSYWNLKNKSRKYSQKLNLAIIERIDLLKQNPEMGIELPFSGTRAMSMGNYKILYRYLAPSIIITAFWDNRQDPEKLKANL